MNKTCDIELNSDLIAVEAAVERFNKSKEVSPAGEIRNLENLRGK